jgi:hypothetical protein
VHDFGDRRREWSWIYVTMTPRTGHYPWSKTLLSLEFPPTAPEIGVV